MRFEKCILNLASKGLKYSSNAMERSITYATHNGSCKKLLFDQNGHVKFWQSLNPQSGEMKVFEVLENTANRRTSSVKSFLNCKLQETQTTTTDFKNLMQITKKENHLTGDIYTQHNNVVSSLIGNKSTVNSAVRDKSIIETNNNLEPLIFKGSGVPMHKELHNFNDSCRRRLAQFIKKNSNSFQSEETKLFINKELRNLLNIDKSFTKLTPLEKDYVAYRGRIDEIGLRYDRDFRIIDNAKVGDIITPDLGYSSAYLNKSYAHNFIDTLGEDHLPTIMYRIHYPKGAVVSRGCDSVGRISLTAPRKAQYEVLSKTTSGINGNCTEIDLRYIPQDITRNVDEIETLIQKYNY